MIRSSEVVGGSRDATLDRVDHGNRIRHNDTVPLNVGKLRRDMNRLAVETWRKIEIGDRQGIRFGEDSLTDHNLWTLAQDHPGLNVYRFSQRQEKNTGADWEWWIGADRTGWICLRIQAKRNYAMSYPRLDHPGNNDDDFQYDALINSCSRDGQYPLHVLYNGWHRHAFGTDNGWPEAADWLACAGNLRPPNCRHAHPMHYGCAVVSSFAIRAIHGRGGKDRRLVASHVSNAKPWSYLFGRIGQFGRFKTDDREPQIGFATDEWLDWVQNHLEGMALDWQVGIGGPVRARRAASERAYSRLPLPAYAQAVRLGGLEESVIYREFTPNAAWVAVLDVEVDEATDELSEEGQDSFNLWE
jgi:hypothetical protein